MKAIIFALVSLANLLAILGTILSIIFPKNWIWPPPEKDSWQFWFTWTVLTIGLLGVPVLGFLDWDTLGYLHLSRFGIGGPLILFGCVFSTWAVRTLSLYQSLGLKGELVTEGPYQYTRNPQYLGYILFYLGLILVTSSFMVLVTGILAIHMFVLAPFSEEPWLRQQFGSKYDEYCANVPRFIGLRSFIR